MRVLQFNVMGQKLTPEGDFSNIVRGSKGMLQCRFNFVGRDTMDSRIIAVFERDKKEYAVAVDLDGTCMIPDELADKPCFKLKLVSVRDKCRMSTDSIIIRQEG